MFHIKNATEQISEILKQLKIDSDVFVTLVEKKGEPLQIKKKR